MMHFKDAKSVAMVVHKNNTLQLSQDIAEHVGDSEVWYQLRLEEMIMT